MPTPARRENTDTQVEYPIALSHPAASATITHHIFKARRACRVDRIEYANPTGLAEDATNAFKAEVKNGSTVLCTLFDTDSDGAGTNTLPTTVIVGTLSTVAGALNLAAGDVLDLVLTEAGSATLPEGRVLVYITEI